MINISPTVFHSKEIIHKDQYGYLLIYVHPEIVTYTMYVALTRPYHAILTEVASNIVSHALMYCQLDGLLMQVTTWCRYTKIILVTDLI